MLRAKLLTVGASIVAAVGGLLLNPTDAVAAAETQACIYGYARICNYELCFDTGYGRQTCSPCYMSWCEDVIAYSCCR